MYTGNIETNAQGLLTWEPIKEYQFFYTCSEGYDYPFHEICIKLNEYPTELHDPFKKRTKRFQQGITMTMKIDSSSPLYNGKSITFRKFYI